VYRGARLDIGNWRGALCDGFARGGRIGSGIDPLADDFDFAYGELLAAKRHGRFHGAGDAQV
jgi:hypothetical protein